MIFVDNVFVISIFHKQLLGLNLVSEKSLVVNDSIGRLSERNSVLWTSLWITWNSHKLQTCILVIWKSSCIGLIKFALILMSDRTGWYLSHINSLLIEEVYLCLVWLQWMLVWHHVIVHKGDWVMLQFLSNIVIYHQMRRRDQFNICNYNADL